MVSSTRLFLGLKPLVRNNEITRQTFYRIANSSTVVNNTCLTRSCLRSFSSGSSMDLLKQLRSHSGAPIVDCKKALQNANNDLNAAMDWLREHGAAKASSKVQGRETTEGLVGIKVSDDGKTASIVRVSSETDFAGRSSKFVDLVLDVAGATLNTNQTGKLENNDVLEAKINDKTIKDLLDESIVAIRENISVADAIKFATNEGIFVGYVHNRMNGTDAGTSAAIVELVPINGDVSLETMQSAGKKLAMHIVAAKPQYTSPADVPENDVEKEKEILIKLMGETNKTPEMLEKIVQGKLRKFYESICLTEQPHMIEEKNPKVADVLKNLGIKVKSYTALSIA